MSTPEILTNTATDLVVRLTPEEVTYLRQRVKASAAVARYNMTDGEAEERRYYKYQHDLAQGLLDKLGPIDGK